jgi:tight adherence protein B
MPSSLLFILIVYKSKKRAKLVNERVESLPEIIELIISGLQAGMSITETLVNLGRTGPKCINEIFKKYEENIRNGSNFEFQISLLKEEFENPLADQLFETLVYAGKFGSRNAVRILHELAEFIANDLSLKSEISTRFGWVKNSASLAAAAPWILFLILRTQENARIAYNQPTGQLFMILGFIFTLFAYFWMQQISKFPQAKRIFINKASHLVLQ